MATPLPPVLRRKLRQYRFALGTVVLVETVGLAGMLLALGGLAWTPLALVWPAARWLRRPTNRQIARRLGRGQPALQEKLTAAVQLAESQDPASMRGSPELLTKLLAEVDRAVAAVPISPLIPRGLAAALLFAGLLANMLGPPRPGALRSLVAPAPASPVGPTAAPSPAKVTSATERLEQLRQLAAALKSLPDTLLRSLPPHARSLDPAVDGAQRAAQALAAGATAEAQALEESVAESLSELARLARPAPRLAGLAADADALARAYAAASTRAVRLNPNPSNLAATNLSVIAAAAGREPVGAAPLPAAPGGVAWRAPVAPLGATATRDLAPFAVPYDRQIEAYFERIAKLNP